MVHGMSPVQLKGHGGGVLPAAPSIHPIILTITRDVPSFVLKDITLKTQWKDESFLPVTATFRLNVPPSERRAAKLLPPLKTLLLLAGCTLAPLK